MRTNVNKPNQTKPSERNLIKFRKIKNIFGGGLIKSKTQFVISTQGYLENKIEGILISRELMA